MFRDFEVLSEELNDIESLVTDNVMDVVSVVNRELDFVVGGYSSCLGKPLLTLGEDKSVLLLYLVSNGEVVGDESVVRGAIGRIRGSVSSDVTVDSLVFNRGRCDVSGFVDGDVRVCFRVVDDVHVLYECVKFHFV